MSDDFEADGDFYDADNDPIDEGTVARMNQNPVNRSRRDRRLVGAIDDEEMRIIARRSPGHRARAALRMREAMRSWTDIVWVCGFQNAKQAQAAVTQLLASTVDDDDVTTARQVFIGTLERQTARSLALAGASHIENPDGEVVRNADQLAWHREAREDLKLLGQAAGLMKAQQIEILNPQSDEIQLLAQRLIEREGRNIVEADVIEWEEVPDEPEA